MLILSLSMSPIMPVLRSFLFVGICQTLDVYQVFTIEPMHSFRLDLSRTLKEAAMKRLLPDELMTIALSRRPKMSRSFRSIRT